MKRGPELLKKKEGQFIDAVTVSVWFYKKERYSESCSAAIRFEDGQEFFLGCAGDGSVLVMQSVRDVGEAPGMTTRRQEIGGLRGDLRDVLAGGSSLKVSVGGRSLLLTNIDDELEILVDGEGLPKEVYSRS